MSKLLRNRWLHRAVFVWVLIALGVGVYRFTPPEPMCVIAAGELEAIFFADAGRRLATLSRQHVGGCLQLWDTRTGKEIARYLKDGDRLGLYAFSKDGRYFVAEIDKQFDASKLRQERHVLFRIDLIQNKTLELPISNSEHTHQLTFSPLGSYLVRESNVHFDFNQKLMLRTLHVYQNASGTTLAQRETVNNWGWDSSENLMFFRPVIAGGYEFEIWRPRTKGTLAQLKDVEPGFSTSAGGTILLLARSGNDKQIGRWIVWNLSDQRVQAEFQYDSVLSAKDQIISPDGRWLAMICAGKDGWRTDLCDLATGQHVGTIQEELLGWAFSPDGRFLVGQGLSHMTVFRMPRGEPLWKQKAALVNEVTFFSHDGQSLIALTNREDELACFDSETGRMHSRVFQIDFTKFEQRNNLRMNPDRRFLLVLSSIKIRHKFLLLDWIPWLCAFFNDRDVDSVVVFDADACRDRFRLEDWNTHSALLSDDGCTLVTTHYDPENIELRELRTWDVNGCKPLHWPIGVPATCGLLLFCLAKGFVRLRNRHGATKASQFVGHGARGQV